MISSRDTRSHANAIIAPKKTLGCYHTLHENYNFHNFAQPLESSLSLSNVANEGCKRVWSENGFEPGNDILSVATGTWDKNSISFLLFKNFIFPTISEISFS